MKITRRQFLKYVSAAAATMGVTQAEFAKVLETMAKDGGGAPRVVWMSGQACTGCTMSLVNLYSETSDPVVDGYDVGSFYAGYDNLADALLTVIDLDAHETIQGAAGDLAMDVLQPWNGGTPLPAAVLVVEGAIPCNGLDAWGNALIGNDACTIGSKPFAVDPGQAEITMRDAVVNYVQHVGYVLAVGQCATYGGIPAAYSDAPDPVQDGAWSGAKGLQGACAGTAAASDAELFKNGGKLFNIPGCPPHPDWIYGTIARLILTLGGASGLLAQDDAGRPTAYYGETIHGPGGCPRYQDYNNGYLASRNGEKGCLAAIGCYGMSTHADCAKRGWNSSRLTLGKKIHCIEAGHPCISCTEPGYPFKIGTNG